jgi:hypothetical protein
VTCSVFHDAPYKTIADVEYATAGLGRLVQPAKAPLDPG